MSPPSDDRRGSLIMPEASLTSSPGIPTVLDPEETRCGEVIPCWGKRP